MLDVLTLNSKEIYSEKGEATIVKELADRNLMIVQPKQLIIRRTEYPFPVQAILPWDKNLEFIDAFMVKAGDERIIVGYNSKHCFRWNPREDLMATNFFDVKKGDEIVKLFLISQGQNLVLEIFTQKSRYSLIDFSELFSSNLPEHHFSSYIRLPQSGKFYCKKSLSLGVKGDCIFEVNALGEYQPLITVESLWKKMAAIPEVSAEHQDYLLKLKKEGDKDHFYPYIQDLNIMPAKWLAKDILIVKIRFGFREGASSSALFFIDPKYGFEHPLLTVLFLHKNCFSYDIISVDNNMNLIVGYLDSGDVGDLIQYFENINTNEFIVAGNQPGIFPQDRLTSYKLRDMFSAIIATPERAFINEEGHILHGISLPGLAVQTIDLEERIVAVHYTDTLEPKL